MSDQNMFCDSTWQRICDDIRNGVYSFLFASPPCRTFSEARHEQPGPPVLLDHEYPYGYPKSQGKSRGLQRSDFDKVREDNLLADRTAQACKLIAEAQGGYAVEQPHPWKGGVCMFDMLAFQGLVEAGARTVLFDQCMFGQVSTKPTVLLCCGGELQRLACRCDHEGGHPSLVGRRDKSGEYLTKQFAAYPGRLNEAIVEIICDALQSNGSS